MGTRILRLLTGPVISAASRRPMKMLRLWYEVSLADGRRHFSSSMAVEELEESTAAKLNEATTSRAVDKPFDGSELFAQFRADDETFDFDEAADRVYAALRAIDPDHVFTDSAAVKDLSAEQIDVSEMETGEESSSRPANRFRSILYDEGELDNSDFDKPPSQQNPHPFDPNSVAPTHARSLAAYVNHLPVLQRLIDLGVDLMEVELTTNIGRHLIRLDWEQDVKPKVFWLVKQVGVAAKDVGAYLTRNPFFLLQPLDQMKARVKYLESKGFNNKAITKIVVTNRYWLNHDEKTIDGRLGYVQRQFGLRGTQVRDLIVKEPRLIMFGVGPMQHLTLMFNRELGFTHEQIREMLLEDPRLFMSERKHITSLYHYATKVMQLPLDQLVKYPLILRCRLGDVRRRHEFLHRLGRARYDETLDDGVKLSDVLHSSDRHFAERVAGVRLEDYDKFQKLS